MKSRLLFIILAVASIFSVAYVTGIIKETRYVYDVVVQYAEYDKICNAKEAKKRAPAQQPPNPFENDSSDGLDWINDILDEVYGKVPETYPGGVPKTDDSPPPLPYVNYENCLVKKEVWGYNDCDYQRKAARIEYCFGIKEFSPMRTGVLVLVSLTGLMYFKIRKQ